MIRVVGEDTLEAVRAFLARHNHLPADFLAPSCRYWAFILPSGEVVGTVALEYGAACGLLRSAFVHPAHRGGGIGRALVGALLAEARRAGLRRVYLFSTGAGAYWERLGFRQVPVQEVVDELPDAPQVLDYQARGCLATEVAYRLDIAKQGGARRHARESEESVTEVGDATPERRRASMRRLALLLVVGPLLGGCTTVKRLAYEGFSRDRWQQSERVIAILGIRPGDRVADLGAGSGYFTERLARAVAPGGRVYAVDVDVAMNEYLQDRLARAGIDNVTVILGRFDDPLLPDGSVDLVLVVDTYHHIGERPAYFRKLRRDLAPGGRVAVIDFDERAPWYMRWTGHITRREELMREMAEAGYSVTEEFDFIDRQSFVIFRPGT